MIQPVPKSKKERKSISRQVNLAITSPPATTEYLKWSDQIVRFSRVDHPRKVPRPGHSPMVLKAQIGGYDVRRVFIFFLEMGYPGLCIQRMHTAFLFQ
jgi:hypothetical protein